MDKIADTGTKERIKCRYCHYTLPAILETGPKKGKEAWFVMRNHILRRHEERLTPEEHDNLMHCSDDFFEEATVSRYVRDYWQDEEG